MKLSRRIEEVFSRNTARPALSHYVSSSSVHTMTYGQLERRVKEFSRFLAANGMRPDELVMSFMSKSLDSIAVLLAVILNGGTACSLNARLKPQQVVSLSALARPQFIVLDRSTVNLILKSEDAAVSNNQFILFGDTPELVRINPSCKTVGTFSQTTSQSPDFVYGRPGYCLFTSGSTGDQKGVLISRDDLFDRVNTEIEDYAITEADNLLSLLPFSFDVGLNQLLSSILSGANLVILNSWFPKDIVSAIKQCNISGISAVPTIWAEVLAFPQHDTFYDDINTLRYITVSGGDLAQKYLLQLRQYFKNVHIYKTYGQSETFRSGILRPEYFEKKMTSVGRPVKGTRIFVLDTNGRQSSPDEEGEIIHYGAGTMIGYINEREVSSNKIGEVPPALKDALPGGRVVFTGDRGKIDKDGFLYVLGREDGMIKTMGYRVYPREIESCILEHPCVTHAAVVGVPDSRKGQVAIAEVVANNGLDKKELITYMRENLPYYMVPDDIHLVVKLPLSENGKIRYAEIRKKYEQR